MLPWAAVAFGEGARAKRCVFRRLACVWSGLAFGATRAASVRGMPGVLEVRTGTPRSWALCCCLRPAAKVQASWRLIAVSFCRFDVSLRYCVHSPVAVAKARARFEGRGRACCSAWRSAAPSVCRMASMCSMVLDMSVAWPSSSILMNAGSPFAARSEIPDRLPAMRSMIVSTSRARSWATSRYASQSSRSRGPSRSGACHPSWSARPG